MRYSRALRCISSLWHIQHPNCFHENDCKVLYIIILDFHIGYISETRWRRVIVPNNDRRKMTCLNWLGAWLYYIRLKIFLYMHNRWILLFQMRYWRSFYSSVLVEKSAVYDNELPLSLLGVASLNTTLSYFLSLITTLQQNSSKNVFLQKKNSFCTFLFGKQAKVSLAFL